MEYLSSLQSEFDDLKPSLFEILSEQQLSALIPPSLRYLLVVATYRHPRYLLRVLNSFDELYATLSLLVERYYLRTFGGSFTENFYSLKRERVLRTKDGEIPRAQLGAPALVRETLKLRTTSDVWKNLAVLVGLPYLKRKLDAGYEIHAAPRASLISSGMGNRPRYHPGDELPQNPTLRQRLLHYYKWFLRNVYPSVNAAYYFSILAFNLAYLFDNTKYSSPLLWLIGTRIRRLGPADHRAIATAMQRGPRNGDGGARSRQSRSNPVGLLYNQVFSSLRFLLPLSIFALKFLEWWHASGFEWQLAQKAAETLDLPAPVVTGMVAPPSKDPAPETAKQHSLATGPKPKLAALRRPPQAPISSTSLLRIFTVPLPAPDLGNGDVCPICLDPLMNPAACQTGYVFCYSCIFRWLNGEHERQIYFMSGEGGGAAWEDEYGCPTDEGTNNGSELGTAAEAVIARSNDDDLKPSFGKRSVSIAAAGEKSHSRIGKWESGKGRCPITGRRVLGGTEGLRRVLI